MTISLVNPATWGSGDELTYTQTNGLDSNGTYALDKRAGETDTLESVVSLTGSGRIVENVATGANADTTYVVDAANRVIRVTSAVTADRVYTLSATGAVTGDQVTIFAEPSFITYEITVNDQAAAAMYLLGNLATSTGQWATFIYIGGWRLFRSSGGGGVKSFTESFSVDGTWTCPANVFRVQLHGVGAGGGGGAGGGTAVSYPCSGAGGGGAQAGVLWVPVAPGVTYTVTVGTGGTAGAGSGGADGAAGGDGGNTTFDSLATFYGAGGGAGGGGLADYAQGGPSMKTGGVLTAGVTLGQRPLAGQGGWGTPITLNNSYRVGGASSIAAGGARGSDAGGSSQYRGGGGGGASGFPGCAAGPGGAAGVVSPTAGTAGTLGAGGGGGGGAVGGGGAGASGGVGGNGAVTVMWVL